MRKRHKTGEWVAAITLASLAAAFLCAGASAQDELTARQIIERAEELMRSQRAYSETTMQIVTPDWRRTLTFRTWDDRAGRRTFIHILSPARDEDTTFLRLETNLWIYQPRAERVIKIPPSMMHQSWMGSDFDNDDLVRESSLVRDYEHELRGYEEIEGLRCYLLSLTPVEGAPVTWGRIEIAISVEPFVPVRYRFYNRRGELRRTMVMSEIEEMGGRMIPTVWTMRNVDKEGYATVMRLDAIEFDQEFEDRIFTRQYLRNPR